MSKKKKKKKKSAERFPKNYKAKEKRIVALICTPKVRQLLEVHFS